MRCSHIVISVEVGVFACVQLFRACIVCDGGPRFSRRPHALTRRVPRRLLNDLNDNDDDEKGGIDD